MKLRPCRGYYFASGNYFVDRNKQKHRVKCRWVETLLTCTDITSRDFNFTCTGQVRLSTLWRLSTCRLALRRCPLTLTLKLISYAQQRTSNNATHDAIDALPGLENCLEKSLVLKVFLTSNVQNFSF